MPRTYRTIPPLTEQDIQRFWSKVDKSKGQGPSGDCWEWQAARFKNNYLSGGNGYGCFGVNGKCYVASRIAYSLSTDGDLTQYMICHICDNPPCCNPAHLFKGTAKDNSQDMIRKGRSLTGERNPSKHYPERLARGEKSWARQHPELIPRGEKHWTRRLPERIARGGKQGTHTHPESVRRGEEHGCAKITKQAVFEMRELYDTGKLRAFRALGRLYGVSGTHAKRIVLRVVWKHLQP